MIKFRSILIISLIPFMFLTSCAAKVEEEIKKIDIYDADKLTSIQIDSQIKIREKRIAELRTTIFKLMNHNEKFKPMMSLENSYGRESVDLKRFVELDNQLINKYQTEINKLNLEIRVLKNKSTNVVETGDYKF